MKIWIGLLLSIVLFPLLVFGSITFIGVYIAGVWGCIRPRPPRRIHPSEDMEGEKLGRHDRKIKEKIPDKLVDEL